MAMMRFLFPSLLASAVEVEELIERHISRLDRSAARQREVHEEIFQHSVLSTCSNDFQHEFHYSLDYEVMLRDWTNYVRVTLDPARTHELISSVKRKINDDGAVLHWMFETEFGKVDAKCPLGWVSLQLALYQFEFELDPSFLMDRFVHTRLAMFAACDSDLYHSIASPWGYMFYSSMVMFLLQVQLSQTGFNPHHGYAIPDDPERAAALYAIQRARELFAVGDHVGASSLVNSFAQNVVCDRASPLWAQEVVHGKEDIDSAAFFAHLLSHFVEFNEEITASHTYTPHKNITADCRRSCPQGTTLTRSCECEQLFPPAAVEPSVCIYMVDSRDVMLPEVIDEVMKMKYHNLVYLDNLFYAAKWGYQLHWVTANNMTQHFPARQMHWAKLYAIMSRMEQTRGDCEFMMVIDSDEYFRTEEPLSGVINHYLPDGKLMFFAEESGGGVQGGFFIIRNNDAGLKLLEEWYHVPDADPAYRHMIEEFPREQGCFTDKMLPKYRDRISLGSGRHFGHPQSLMIRHNYLKHVGFEYLMMDRFFKNVQGAIGCVLCSRYYNWWDIARATNLIFDEVNRTLTVNVQR